MIICSFYEEKKKLKMHKDANIFIKKLEKESRFIINLHAIFTCFIIRDKKSMFNLLQTLQKFEYLSTIFIHSFILKIFFLMFSYVFFFNK